MVCLWCLLTISVFILSYRFGLAVLFLCRDHKVPVQLCAYCDISIVYSSILITSTSLVVVGDAELKCSFSNKFDDLVHQFQHNSNLDPRNLDTDLCITQC